MSMQSPKEYLRAVVVVMHRWTQHYIASGIPDFRFLDNWNLREPEKFKLPYPRQSLNFEYFKTNPGASCIWAKEYFPGINFLPNKGHFTQAVGEEKGKLSKYFKTSMD